MRINVEDQNMPFVFRLTWVLYGGSMLSRAASNRLQPISALRSEAVFGTWRAWRRGTKDNLMRCYFLENEHHLPPDLSSSSPTLHASRKLFAFFH